MIDVFSSPTDGPRQYAAQQAAEGISVSRLLNECDHHSEATPIPFVKLGMPLNPGRAIHGGRFIWAIDGQELCAFAECGTCGRCITGKYAKQHKCSPDAYQGFRSHPDVKVDQDLYFARLATGGIPMWGGLTMGTHAVTREEQCAALGLSEKAPSTISRKSRREKLTRRINRRYGGAHRHELRVGQGTPPEDLEIEKQYWWGPSPDEAAKQKDTPVAWLVERPGGYFWVPGWVFHPLNPVKGPTARKVFAFLCSYGLLQKISCRKHKKKPELKACPTCRRRVKEGRETVVQISLGFIARALSIHPETVSKALKKWKKYGILEVVRPWAAKMPGHEGFLQEKLTISYLPKLRLTSQVVEMERKRLRTAAGKQAVVVYEDTKGRLRRKWSPWYDAARNVHQSLLEFARQRDWDLAHFWIECRRRLAIAEIPEDRIAQLIPRPPD